MSNQMVDYYEGQDADARVECRVITDRIRTNIDGMSRHIIEVGRDLAAMKERLGHGNYLAWLDTEFSLSLRTAQRWVSVYNKFGKYDRMSHLGSEVLTALAAPSMPEEVSAKAIAKAEAGEVVTMAEVIQMKQEWEAERDKLKEQVKNAKSSKSTARSDRAAAGHLIDNANSEIKRLQGELTNTRHELQQERRKHLVTGEDAVTQLQLQRLLDAWDGASDAVKADFRNRINGSTVVPFARGA